MSDCLAVLPFRVAFLNESAEAFLGVARQHVFDHHLRRIIVSLSKRHFGLPVEGLLADLDRMRLFAGDLFGEFDCSGALVPGWHHLVDETDAQSLLGRDQLAGQQHLHGMLARHVP